MTGTLRIELPWPPEALSPNGSHGHWAKKRDAKKRYRHACETATLLVTRGRKAMDVALRVHLQFVPPDRRSRDVDNLVARMKSGLDGIATALQIDDGLFRIERPEILAPARTKIEAMVVLTLSVDAEVNPRPERTSRAADNKER
jgi:crossover junction endodeoxyribonuclease RusA